MPSLDLPVADIAYILNRVVRGLCVWLPSFNMFLGFSHSVACSRIPLLFTVGYCCAVWVDHVLTVRSSFDGQEGFSTF